jgi:hypothetical protein
MTQVQTILTFVELLKNYPELFLGQMKTQQKLNKIGSGLASPSYDRGADIVEILSNSMHDIEKILGQFFPCWDWKIVGLCMRITWTGVSFAPYTSYRLPKQKVDNHPQEFQHHYLPKLVNEFLIDAAEDVYYPMIDEVSEWNIDFAGKALKSEEAIGGPNLPSAPDFSANRAAADALENATPQDKRWRGANDMYSGWTKNEFTVIPELFSKVFDNITYANCHKKKNGSIWSSDYPLSLLPARWGTISFIINPLGMINRFIMPQTCLGSNSWLRGGKTPIDMLYTGNTTLDSARLAWPSTGCQGTNQGPWLPVTHGATTAFRSTAAAIGVRKGMETARSFMPSQFYKFDPSKDRVQWTRNKRMPKSCKKIEQFVLDYNRGNHEKDDEDPWFMAEVWKYFRCCPSGYFVILGPSKQIKE